VLGLACLAAAAGQGVTVDSDPVLTESVSNPNSSCPLTAPTTASAFHATDPILTVWIGLSGLTPQNSALFRFSYKGTSEPTLDWNYPTGSFQSGFNYLLCPSVGTASILGGVGQNFAALFPNGGGAGSWTLGIYINGSSSPITTIPFTVLGNVTVLDKLTSNTTGLVNGSCTAPPLVASFATTSPQVWLYFDVTGALAGDSAQMKFLRPDGVLYTTLSLSVGSPGPNGYVCFSDGIPISGASAASYLGTWSIQVFWDQASTPLFTLNFTLGSTNSAITSVTTAFASPVIAQNTYIVIKGLNLVPANTPASGAIWSSAPSFASGLMPTQLGGVSVTVNNKPAFVYFYCSAATDPACTQDQLNILTPLDNTIGPVPVVVTSGAVSSPQFTANMQAVAPSFLLFSTAGYVAATHLNNTLVGPASLYPGSSTPARPGEQIALYAVGFGLPTNALVNGSASQSGSLPVLPVCQVGGAPAALAFAGLISPGLYQLNLTIPATAANGDNAVSCTYGGSTTPAGDLITAAPPAPTGVTLLHDVTSSTASNPNNVCTVPPSVTSFPVTAPNMNLFWDVIGAKAGDYEETDFYRPDGTVFYTNSGGVATPGSNTYLCFWYQIPIAGAPAASYPGTWTARSYWNHSSNPLYSLSFTVVGATPNPTLTITTSGTGSGTVSSSPAGTSCGSGCLSFAAGTVVTLTATPNTGSTFAGWSGACAGTGTCILTMTDNKTVTATFVAQLTLLDDVTSGQTGTPNSVCTVPPSIKSFQTTAPGVYLFFDVDGAVAGDVQTTSFYRPDGVIYFTDTGTVTSVGAKGYYCFGSEIFIAGYPGASYPGVWTVSTSWNHAAKPLFSLNFNLVPTGNGISITSLSSSSPTPLTPLQIKTSGLNASAALQVQFSNTAGFSVTAQPIRVTSDGTVIVAVPIYVEPSTNKIAQGIVSIVLTQGSQSTPPMTMTIQTLPPLSSYGTQLGQISHDFLVFEALLHARRIDEMQALQPLLNGKVDTSAAQATLQSLLAAAISSRSDVDSILLNNGTIVSWGSLPNGPHLQFDVNSLDIMDRIIGAYLTQEFAGLPSSSSTSNVRTRLPGSDQETFWTPSASSSFNLSTVLDLMIRHSGPPVLIDYLRGKASPGDAGLAAADATVPLLNKSGATDVGGFVGILSGLGHVQSAVNDMLSDLSPIAECLGMPGCDPSTILAKMQGSTLGAVASIASTVSKVPAVLGLVSEAQAAGTISTSLSYSVQLAKLGSSGQIASADATDVAIAPSPALASLGTVTGVTNWPSNQGVTASQGSLSLCCIGAAGSIVTGLADQSGGYDFFVPIGVAGTNYADLRLSLVDPVSKAILGSETVDLRGLNNNTPVQVAPLTGVAPGSSSGHTYSGALNANDVITIPLTGFLSSCTPNPEVVTGVTGASANLVASVPLESSGSFSGNLTLGIQTATLTTPTLTCTEPDGTKSTIPGMTETASTPGSTLSISGTSDGHVISLPQAIQRLLCTGTGGTGSLTACSASGAVSVLASSVVVTLSVNSTITLPEGVFTSTAVLSLTEK
jgi:uncharacterized protein (TIGR03437 family)